MPHLLLRIRAGLYYYSAGYPGHYLIGRKMLKPLALLILTSLFSHLAYAEGPQRVTWATPEWEGSVEKDGTGLYNEVIFAAFKHVNIEVNQIIVPWKRAELMVQDGHADMYGGLDPTDEYPQALYPISVITEAVTFLPEHFGEWKGVTSLEGKNGVWIRGYTDYIDDKVKQYLQGEDLNSRESALSKVYLKRADYYFDNLRQTNITFSNILVDKTQFRTEPVTRVFLYMTFAKNERGEYLREKYNEGVAYLIETHQLLPLYEKYGREYPIE
ncbi:hypothetical protein ENC22_02905 [Hahella sp. KA22]|nr:hypothetical protein ENC22_02905 [Hahella sp. KA22]